jgi:glutamate/tyrosine decarboxylase-like PLP-dependent enzyme
VGRFYIHDSPYTYFTSSELHLGEISLECSRAGAAAVALWATQKLLPLIPGGDFAAGLDRSRHAAQSLRARIEADPRFIAGPPPQLDIVVWALSAPSLGESSRLAQEAFDHAAQENLHLALVHLPVAFFRVEHWPGARADDKVTCLRSVLMKPEHDAWIPGIWERLIGALEDKQ